MKKLLVYSLLLGIIFGAFTIESMRQRHTRIGVQDYYYNELGKLILDKDKLSQELIEEAFSKIKTIEFDQFKELYNKVKSDNQVFLKKLLERILPRYLTQKNNKEKLNEFIKSAEIPDFIKDQEDSFKEALLEPYFKINVRRVLFNNNVNSLAINQDGSRLAVGFEDSIRIFNPQTWQAIKKLSDLSGRVTNVALSPNGQFLAANLIKNDRNGVLKVWDTENYNEIFTFDSPLTYPGAVNRFTTITFSNDNQILTAGSSIGYIHVWDLPDFTQRTVLGKARPSSGHNEIVRSLIFSDNNNWLISGGEDQRVIVWDTANWSEIARLRFNKGDIGGNATSLLLILNDQFLLIGLKEALGLTELTLPSQALKVINTDNWNEIDPLADIGKKVGALASNNQGTLLLVGHTDGTISFIETGVRGLWKIQAIIKEHNKGVKIALFDNQRSFITTSSDNTIKVWPYYSVTGWQLLLEALVYENTKQNRQPLLVSPSSWLRESFNILPEYTKEKLQTDYRLITLMPGASQIGEEERLSEQLQMKSISE